MESARKILFAWLLPVTAGLLGALALPPNDAGELGWICLLPLLFAVEDCRLGEAFRRGYIAGLVFFGATLWWTIYTTQGGAPLPAAMLGTVSLVAFLSLYYGAAAAWFRLTVPPKTDVFWRNLAAAIVGTAGWVTLEWVRGHFLLGGFGWNDLGVTQHRSPPLIQVASFTGVYGVSALVCFVNFALFQTLRRFIRNLGAHEPIRRLSFEFYIATVLVCGTFIRGLHEIDNGHAAEVTRVLRVALVQGNIPQTLKFDPSEKPMILERYRSLTETTLLSQPELIIWPESATPEPMRYDLESFALVTNLAVKANAYLLTGTIDFTPRSSPVEGFNAAILVRPDGTLGEIYRKIHLVPFGEYVPLRKILPFMKWLTPIGDSFERGREFTVFHLPEFSFGTLICFEDTVPDLCRQFVRHGVDFMVNLTNDAWFKESPAAEMHLANAIFRCVETRRWLVRCTNNGVTCAVDQFGVEQTRAEPFKAMTKTLLITLPAEKPVTFYARRGDIFVGASALVAGLWGITTLASRRRSA